MPIISDTKKETRFFEQLVLEYRQTPRNERAEFIKSSVKEFQRQVNDMRDEISSIEIGEDAEGRYDINFQRYHR